MTQPHDRAALRAVGYDKNTPNPPGGEIQRDKNGEPTGLLIARPNALILYATLAKGPKLPAEYQYNSTRHFMRELNRLGAHPERHQGYVRYPRKAGIRRQPCDHQGYCDHSNGNTRELGWR